MALLILFFLVLVWGFIARIKDDVVELGLVAPVLVLIVSTIYGSFIWLKTGAWGSFDVLTVYCTLNQQCFDIYSYSSFIGFANLNNWYLDTNVAWTAALVPMFGNMFCTLALDNIEFISTCKKNSLPSNNLDEHHK
ncbi:hypothetical protein [Psychromonas sp.]|uniref:hypothetical protein n=1 Tax=Psychromonas sp. TaxID=1884585 RepID=UPI003569DD32